MANCRIHDFGRIDRTYTPGVQLEGVANRVAHNLFHVWQSLREGRQPQTVYTSGLYQQRYPLIATMLREPAVNHSWRNLFYRCDRAYSNPAGLDRLANEFATDRNPGFVDPDHGNLRLQPGAPVINAIGFRPIPVDEIGLYPDTWRPAAGNELPPR